MFQSAFFPDAFPLIQIKDHFYNDRTPPHLHKSTYRPQLFSQSLFQVRVSHNFYTYEPPTTGILLTIGERLGGFRKKDSRSFQECSKKYVSFDFASDSQFGQFFVTLLKQTAAAAEGELPEIKMYGEMESWKWPVEGKFINYVGQSFFVRFWRSSRSESLL